MIAVRNQQRMASISARGVRELAALVLRDFLGRDRFEISFYFVSSRRMAQMNRQFLRHPGPTDVITFDYSDGNQPLHGEIFICPQVALGQARQFGASVRDEIARYVIHGLLHLCGYDDRKPADRTRMRRKENRVLRAVGHRTRQIRPRWVRGRAGLRAGKNKWGKDLLRPSPRNAESSIPLS